MSAAGVPERPEAPQAAYAVERGGEEALADLTRLRVAWSAEHGLDATDDAARNDFRDRMTRWWDQQAGQRVAWVVRTPDGEAVAMANLAVFTRMPRPGVPDVRWAYVANVWVDPAHRQRRVGTLLMETMVGWARVEGMIRIVLNPSEMSIPLYRGLGFTAAEDLLRLDL